MREILFRGWDLNRKCWLKGRELQQGLIFNYNKNDYGAVSVDEYDNKNGYAHDLGTDLDLMQFTGLLDKNGKRIFEGDILQVEIHDHWNNQVIASQKCAVEFENCKFGVRFGHATDFTCLDGFANTTFEVIGNIYDNPELLEVDDNAKAD